MEHIFTYFNTHEWHSRFIALPNRCHNCGIQSSRGRGLSSCDEVRAMPNHDWTINAAARIAENDSYLVALYDIADGEYDIAYVRPKSLDALDGAAQAAREALIAFDIAMQRR